VSQLQVIEATLLAMSVSGYLALVGVIARWAWQFVKAGA
jgi:hypothetical protein